MATKIFVSPPRLSSSYAVFDLAISYDDGSWSSGELDLQLAHNSSAISVRLDLLSAILNLYGVGSLNVVLLT